MKAVAGAVIMSPHRMDKADALTPGGKSGSGTATELM